MAAPSPTSRSTPSGFQMPDGYQSFITFANKPAVQLWEKTVKPPGFDGGEGIDTTTMFNQIYRTKRARHLRTLTDATANCAYDPDALDDLLSLINSETTITIRFPDNTSLAFWGYMQKVEFADLKEGEQPMASVTVTPMNYDPTTNTINGPVLTEAAGT